MRPRRLARVLVMALLVAGALGVGASTALGLLLHTTSRPLPGSNFQGGDGNQANGQHLIDWEKLQADGLVAHQPDLGPGPPHNACSGNPATGPGCDDHFGAPGSPSSTELNPGGWTLTTQGSLGGPAYDILDVYHSFRRGTNGDAFLYLAMTRLAATGTVFLTFELNQVAEPAFFSNGFAVPCRTTGDLLITFQQHGSGANVTTRVVVQEWITNTEQANGCAATGRLEDVTEENPTVTRRLVQGSFNEGSIHNFLPGCGRSGCFAQGHNIPARHFMEAAINLTKVLRFESEPCDESQFLSVWAHSRASSAEGPGATSDMKDYVAPQTVVEEGCKARATLTTLPHADVNGEVTTGTPVHASAIWDQASLSGGAAPTGDLTFHLYGPNDSTCTGTPIFTDTVPITGADGPWNSKSFEPTAPGTYEWRVAYSGDGNNHAFGPTACGAEPVTVTPTPPPPPPPSPAHPSLSTSASPTTAPYGSAVGDTATLTGGADPTGTIEFRLYGPDDASCAGPPAFVFRQDVHGNGSYPSPTPTPTLSGTYRWVAEYSGDAHNAGVSTSCGESGEIVVVESPFPIHPAPEEPEPTKPTHPHPTPHPKPHPKPRPRPRPPVFTG